MKIVKDGIPFIGIPLLAGIIFLAFSVNIPGIALIMLGLFCAFFFRDPKLELTQGDNLIVSPADGRVMEVAEEDGKKTVRIFLSVFNVHLQRSPCKGKIKGIEYIPGKFLPAMAKNAHKINEQNVFTIDTPRGDIVIKQIAGILARRVVSWVKPGDSLEQCQKIGFIKFGSQVDILLPGKPRLVVNPGDKTVAGQTVIARFD